MLHEGEDANRAWNKLTMDQRVAAREASIQLNDRVLYQRLVQGVHTERSQGRNLPQVAAGPGESDEQQCAKDNRRTV